MRGFGFSVLAAIWPGLTLAESDLVPLYELTPETATPYTVYTRCIGYKSAVTEYIGVENHDADVLKTTQAFAVTLYSAAVADLAETMRDEEARETADSNISVYLDYYRVRFQAAAEDGDDPLQTDALLAADSHFCGMLMVSVLGGAGSQ